MSERYSQNKKFVGSASKSSIEGIKRIENKTKVMITKWVTRSGISILLNEVGGQREKLQISNRGGQRIGLMSQNVLVHSITRGFAVPKTVRLRQSLSLNLFGVQTQITGIHLVDKNFKNQIT